MFSRTAPFTSVAARRLGSAAAAAQPTRAFHSPFTVLNRISATSTPKAASTTQAQPTSTEVPSNAYEKQLDASPEPAGLAGARMYVVSDPDPTNAPYAIPSGAYPVAAPFAA